MKSLSATALFALAVITECFGAHDRGSRQRSGPIRSVPVAANIKREVDFDCPEEFGYYPHPTDCTLYYVCVFGGALLESCTGGLMYSHELQTCDWPRNVGCDATGAVVADDLERINEREPPPPPPPRRNPPPPPRAQPNPIITSRGQPKFNRQEYEQQQQLYAEVDDLPPVEELENDRQQRVYRGQPSTIGQVQKDRDGYGSQSVSSGRTLNSNIIPSSINQNSKIGSFSFGTQVDDRRTATVTPAPQTYSLEPTESITPSSYSASPRPKMLYNGSQAYTPDQYDPYYAVYDEDGELYKDTDYVQQYNTASLRPAVQQTYRGTPPPARRPVETYTPRPSLDDYDDTLIQGQISNQNQYQTPVRQPSRGEGNELGYDHIPSSVRTTVFEAASLRTTPSTTSTSTTTTTTTTTRRPTTAPYIEAKTPSRQTLRSSTDEKHNSVPDPIENQNSYDKPTSLTPTISPVINFSSLAKPFEKTDNSHRLSLPSTEDLPTRVLPSRVTNKKANIPINTVQIVPTQSHKKMFSLTTGFSIRRNVDNSKNPYTLTLISKPLESSSNSKIKSFRINNDTKKHSIHRIQYEASSTTHFPETKHTTELGYKDEDSSVLSRNNFRSEIIEDEDVSIYLKPPTESSTIKPRTRSSTIPTTDGTKYYLKTVLKRPVPLNTDSDYPTESNIQNEDPIEIDSQKYEYEESDTSNIEKPNNWKVLEYNDKYNEPFISYKSLDENNENEKDTLTNYELDLGATSTVSSISTTTPTTSFPSTTPLQNTISSMKSAARKPSYYLYHVEDDAVAEHTTEVFSNKVKNVIKSFIDNLSSSSVSNLAEHSSSSVSPDLDEKVVNIGFLKKKQYFTSEKPLRSNIKHVKIITEPNIIRFMTPTVETITFMGPNVNNKYIFTSSAKTTTSSITELPILVSKFETDLSQNISTFDDTLSKENAKSKFSSFLKGKLDIENSQIYQKIVKDIPNISETTQYNKPNYIINTTPIKSEDVSTSTESDDQRQINDYISEIVSTTSTTKSTTTLKTEIETKPTTKSISFPTRASRINPAIKLAAAKIGGGRRSYQSSSNCSSDNSLQANTKCNEIKYQRYLPASTLSTLMFHNY